MSLNFLDAQAVFAEPEYSWLQVIQIASSAFFLFLFYYLSLALTKYPTQFWV